MAESKIILSAVDKVSPTLDSIQKSFIELSNAIKKEGTSTQEASTMFGKLSAMLEKAGTDVQKVSEKLGGKIIPKEGWKRALGEMSEATEAWVEKNKQQLSSLSETKKLKKDFEDLANVIKDLGGDSLAKFKSSMKNMDLGDDVVEGLKNTDVFKNLKKQSQETWAKFKKEAKASFKDVGKLAKKIAKTLGKVFKAAFKVISAAFKAVWKGIESGIKALKELVEDSVEAYMSKEEIYTTIKIQLDDDSYKEFVENVSRLQRQSTESREDIASVYRAVIGTGKSGEEAYKWAYSILAVARATGKEISAVQTWMLHQQNASSMLERWGIVIEGLSDDTMDIDKIYEHMKPIIEGLNDTTLQMKTNLSNAWTELKEQIGESFSPVLKEVFVKATDLLDKLRKSDVFDKISIVLDKMWNTLEPLIDKLVNVIMMLSDTSNWSKAWDIIKNNWSSFKTAIGKDLGIVISNALKAALSGIGTAITELWPVLTNAITTLAENFGEALLQTDFGKWAYKLSTGKDVLSGDTLDAYKTQYEGLQSIYNDTKSIQEQYNTKLNALADQRYQVSLNGGDTTAIDAEIDKIAVELEFLQDLPNTFEKFAKQQMGEEQYEAYEKYLKNPDNFRITNTNKTVEIPDGLWSSLIESVETSNLADWWKVFYEQMSALFAEAEQTTEAIVEDLTTVSEESKAVDNTRSTKTILGKLVYGFIDSFIKRSEESILFSKGESDEPLMTTKAGIALENGMAWVAKCLKATGDYIETSFKDGILKGFANVSHDLVNALETLSFDILEFGTNLLLDGGALGDNLGGIVSGTISGIKSLIEDSIVYDDDGNIESGGTLSDIKFGDAASVALQIIAEKLLPYLQKGLEAIGTLFDQVFEIVGDAVQILGETLGAILLPLLEAMIPVFQVLAQIIIQIAPVISSVLQPAILIISQVLELLVPILKAVYTLLSPILVVIQWISDFVSWIFSGFKREYNPFKKTYSLGVDNVLSADSNPNTTSQEYASVASQTASYQGASTVHIYNDFNGAYLVGSGGFRELALIMRDELSSTDYYRQTVV